MRPQSKQQMRRLLNFDYFKFSASISLVFGFCANDTVCAVIYQLRFAHPNGPHPFAAYTLRYDKVGYFVGPLNGQNLVMGSIAPTVRV
jgi:hypothetical protein